MVALGFHLFHGIWSSFKSLSMKEDGFSKFMYGFGIFFGAVLSIGFIVIPLYIYFNGGA
jgi:succinate dehydrogenase / fumarate reductase cytochrome b subunit